MHKLMVLLLLLLASDALAERILQSHPFATIERRIVHAEKIPVDIQSEFAPSYSDDLPALLSDGSYWWVSTYEQIPAYNVRYRFMARKYSSVGKLLFEKLLSVGSYSLSADYKFVPLLSGGLAIQIGSNNSGDYCKVIVLSASGKTVWQRQLGQNYPEYCTDIAAASDGGVLLLSSYGLEHFGTDGSRLWSLPRVYGGPLGAFPAKVAAAGDHIWVSGSGRQIGDQGVSAALITQTGQPISIISWLCNGCYSAGLLDMRVTADGGLLVGGRLGAAVTSGFLARFRSDGVLAWANVLSGDRACIRVLLDSVGSLACAMNSTNNVDLQYFNLKDGGLQSRFTSDRRNYFVSLNAGFAEIATASPAAAIFRNVDGTVRLKKPLGLAENCSIPSAVADGFGLRISVRCPDSLAVQLQINAAGEIQRGADIATPQFVVAPIRQLYVDRSGNVIAHTGQQIQAFDSLGRSVWNFDLCPNCERGSTSRVIEQVTGNLETGVYVLESIPEGNSSYDRLLMVSRIFDGERKLIYSGAPNFRKSFSNNQIRASDDGAYVWVVGVQNVNGNLVSHLKLNEFGDVETTRTYVLQSSLHGASLDADGSISLFWRYPNGCAVFTGQTCPYRLGAHRYDATANRLWQVEFGTTPTYMWFAADSNGLPCFSRVPGDNTSTLAIKCIQRDGTVRSQSFVSTQPIGALLANGDGRWLSYAASGQGYSLQVIDGDAQFVGEARLSNFQKIVVAPSLGWLEIGSPRLLLRNFTTLAPEYSLVNFEPRLSTDATETSNAGVLYVASSDADQSSDSSLSIIRAFQVGAANLENFYESGFE